MHRELEDAAPVLADRLTEERANIDRMTVPREARTLAWHLQRRAPKRSGALRRSIRADGANVLALSYATLQDRGGVVRPLRYRALLVPLTPGWRPTATSTTVAGRYLLDGHGVLRALLMPSVRVPGSGFAASALQAHLATSAKRVARDARRVARLAGTPTEPVSVEG